MKNTTKKTGYSVDLSSFDKNRPTKLKSLIDCLFDNLSHLSEPTQSDYLYDLLYFLNWSDDNNLHTVLENETYSREIYKKYCNYLRDRCAPNSLKSKSAAKYQRSVLIILQALYENDLFGDGVPIIKSTHQGRNTTQAQSESEQAQVLAWSQALFDGFSDFVLNENPFPFKLTIPKHKDWQIDGLWVFPSARMIMTPDTLAIRDKLKRGNWTYNYTNGKLHKREDIAHRYTDQKRNLDGVDKQLKIVKLNLLNANNDLRHRQRKRLASIASLAFLHLMYAYSGQNETPVRSMRWPKNYHMSAERQGFRVIKNRGHKGKVLFELQNTFLPTFIKYLKLREWLLKDSIKTDLLFFTKGKCHTKTPHQWATPTQAYSNRIKNIGIDLPSFGARQFRANKNDYSNSNVDLATSAKAAGHSIQTHTKSYLSGTRKKQSTELSEFFSAIVHSIDKEKHHENQIELGNCKNPGNPEELIHRTNIPPKCGQPEGCLSCKHFFVHADEEDIRKLASGRYVIQKTRHLADSNEHFESLFVPVFDRISNILTEISERNSKLKELVKHIVKEVNEEDFLSDFWANELRYLVDLGLVNE